MVMAQEYLYTLREIADVLRVSEWTVRRLIAAGKLDALRVGKRGVRIPAGSLAAYRERSVIRGRADATGGRMPS